MQLKKLDGLFEFFHINTAKNVISAAVGLRLLHFNVIIINKYGLICPYSLTNGFYGGHNE